MNAFASAFNRHLRYHRFAAAYKHRHHRATTAKTTTAFYCYTHTHTRTKQASKYPHRKGTLKALKIFPSTGGAQTSTATCLVHLRPANGRARVGCVWAPPLGGAIALRAKIDGAAIRCWFCARERASELESERAREQVSNWAVSFRSDSKLISTAELHQTSTIRAKGSSSSNGGATALAVPRKMALGRERHKLSTMLVQLYRQLAQRPFNRSQPRARALERDFWLGASAADRWSERMSIEQL